MTLFSCKMRALISLLSYVALPALFGFWGGYSQNLYFGVSGALGGGLAGYFAFRRRSRPKDSSCSNTQAGGG